MKQIFFTIILLSSLKADEKSELIIDIEKSLMATCCWSGTVYDHGNKEMEIQIAGMVDQGKTKLEIINLSVLTDALITINFLNDTLLILLCECLLL